MKIETSMSKSSKYLLARKRYHHWRNTTKESKIYLAVLFALANGKCPYCNRDMILSFNKKINERDNVATLDHLTPLKVALKTKKYALEIMCKKCNSRKDPK